MDIADLTDNHPAVRAHALPNSIDAAGSITERSFTASGIRVRSGKYCREFFVGVEGVVFRANSNEVAEAELLQNTLGALVVLRRKEGGAQSSFQAWMEC